jgi:predicted acylesterase/phospholipase RssA
MTIRIRLALEGGGARIFAHVAALEALTDALVEFESKHGVKVEVSAIAGTSAGAVAGTLFAAGVRAKHFGEVLTRNDVYTKLTHFRYTKSTLAWRIFTRRPLLDVHLYQRLLEALLRAATSRKALLYSELPVPVYAIAASVMQPREHVYGEDKDENIVEGMLASSNLPLVFFNYKEIGPSQRLDGSVFCNLPVDHLQRFESSRGGPILAFVFKDIPFFRIPKGVFEYIFGIIATNMQSSTRQLKIRNPTNVRLIELECDDVGTFDFKKAYDALKTPLTSPSFGRVKAAATVRIRAILNDLLDEMQHTHSETAKELQYAAVQTDRLDYCAPSPPRDGTNTRFTLVKLPYTGIHEVEALQGSLPELCTKHFGTSFKVEEYTPDTSNERFDAIQRPELAISNEVIYAFPFLLSAMRRAIWGVIPYAWHRAIGLVLSKKFPEAAVFVERSDTNSTPFASKQDSWWMPHLFWRLDEQDGRLYAPRGYLADELLPLMVRMNATDDLQRRFLKHRVAIEGVRQRATAVSEWHIAPDINERILNGNSALLFDLADLDTVAAKFGEEVHVLRFGHRMQIPAGIGYSLPFTKLMAQRNEDLLPRWRILAEEARKRLEPKRDELARAGFQLFQRI